MSWDLAPSTHHLVRGQLVAGGVRWPRRRSAPDWFTVTPPDQGRRAPLRRLEISFSQGAEWKALISRYIGTIPLSGDAPATEHNASTGPPPSTPVSSAIIAKIGAAASDSKQSAPGLGHCRGCPTLAAGESVVLEII